MQPSVVGNRAFVAGCDGQLHVIDLDKEPQCRECRHRVANALPPGLLGDRAFVGTIGNSFVAVDWKKAAIVWQFSDKVTGDQFRSSAAVTADTLVVGCGTNASMRSTRRPPGTLGLHDKGQVDSSPSWLGDACSSVRATAVCINST